MIHYLIYTALFLSSLLLSLLLTPLFMRLAKKWGILDYPVTERKIHREPKPLLGGVAVYLAFFLPIMGGLLFLKFVHTHSYLFSSAFIGALPPLRRELSRIIPFFFAGTLVMLWGLRDDVKPLRVSIKFLGQVLAGLLLALTGIRITFFVPHVLVGGFLTVLWVVALTNSFNLLDNMDGLSTGVALIASFIFLYLTASQKQIFTSALLAIFCGTLLGFLRFNFPPAKIFLGDAGSMWIGFVLATLTIFTTFYTEEMPTFLPVIMPLLILGVPIFDTLSVIIIRWREKRPLFQADKSHFSHRLLTLGMGEKQAVLFIYLVTFCVGINATLLTQVSLGGAIVILIQAMVIFSIIVFLEVTGRRERDKNDNSPKT